MKSCCEVELDPIYTPVPNPGEEFSIINRAPMPMDTKRCVRCGQYYLEKDAQEQSCVHHSGTYKTVLTIHSYGVTQGQWSCCGAKDSRDVGCKTRTHMEDQLTTNILNRFNVQDEDDSLRVPESPQVVSNPTKQEESDDSVEERDTFVKVDGKLHFRHPVALTDTLAGLAIKYSTKVTYLKQINKLFDDKQLYSKVHVLVPWLSEKNPDGSEIINAAQEQKISRDIMLKKFIREHGVSTEEATYYLEEDEYNYEKAARQYKEDLQFEQQSEKKSEKQPEKKSDKKPEKQPEKKSEKKSTSSSKVGRKAQ